MPYGNQDGPSMESAKQERKDLLRDNPVVRDMDSSRPWISKHFQSSMSPLKDGHGDESPMSKHDGKTFEDEGFFNSHFPSGKPKGPEMKDDSKGMPKLYDAAGHMHTPLHQDKDKKGFDRVVLGGNKGDKSKTKPGEKDYEK